MQKINNTDGNRRRLYRHNLARAGEDIFLRAADEVRRREPLTGSGAVEYVFSPLILIFTLWILQNAEKDGVRKLYFLSRDAWIEYVIAKRLCGACGLNLECRYLYCSRYSLRVPMYSENPEEALDYICSGGIDVTFRKLMIRSGLGEAETEEMRADFSDISFDEVIPYASLADYKKKLRANEAFMTRLAENSESRWKALSAYFAQEGLTEEKKIGIVDSGWIGTTQKSICDILKRQGSRTSVYGYYFGLFEHPAADAGCMYRSFYFGPAGAILNKVGFSNCLFEALFSARHGTVRGYKIREDGLTVPVLAQYRGDVRSRSILEMLDLYSRIFVKTAGNRPLYSWNVMDCKKKMQRSVRAFMWDPTAAEAEYFGTFLFSDDLLDENLRETAPVFDANALRDNHFWERCLNSVGLLGHPIRESAWYEASVVRSTGHTVRPRLSYSAYRMLSYILKWIKRRG